MVPGFNHNILYKGVLFHIQTEDSGTKKPLITTLLYRDGTIIASRKTDYSDIITADMLEKVVEDLMKEQHKEMLRRLKSGEFDGRAFPDGAGDPVHEPADESGTTPLQETSDQPLLPPTETTRHEKTLDEMIFDYLVSTKD
jgi:hypothetical protein